MKTKPKTSQIIRIKMDLYNEIDAESKRTGVPRARLVDQSWALYKAHKGRFLDK